MEVTDEGALADGSSRGPASRYRPFSAADHRELRCDTGVAETWSHHAQSVFRGLFDVVDDVDLSLRFGSGKLQP